MSILIYDFEVFKFDWMVTFREGDNYYRFHNDVHGFRDFYERHKEDLWVGHNNTHYDSIMAKCIINGVTGIDLKKASDQIVQDEKGSAVMRQYKLYNTIINDLDLMQDQMFLSLKEIEGFLGLEIHESEVDFTIQRPLTEEEVALVFKYNKDDVDATYEEFKIKLQQVMSKVNLVRMYHLPKHYVSKTNGQLSGEILQAEFKDFKDGTTPFDPSIIPLTIEKYTEAVDFFSKCEKIPYSESKPIMVAGVEHKLGIGGLHGALQNFMYSGEMWLVDVSSYYPNLMLKMGFVSRGIKEPERFHQLVQRRLDNKHRTAELKKLLEKDPDNKQYKQELKVCKGETGALKLTINSISGCMKSKFSKLFDEKNNNNMCVSGQLLLINLIEKLEPYCKLVQSNTDGIIIIPYDKEKCDEAIQEWMDRTGLELEKTVAYKIFQKDVNNYILLEEGGSVHTKGRDVAQYSSRKVQHLMRNHLRILDKMIVEFLLYNKPLEIPLDTPLRDLQNIKKVGSTYEAVYWEKPEGLVKCANTVNRIFPTKDTSYGKVKKKHRLKENLDNLPDIPDHCMIINDNIQDKTLADVMDWIDLDWYVDAAKKAIIAYVLDPKEKTKGRKKDPEVDWQTTLAKIKKYGGEE
jgi:hypothetical protein